MSESVDAFLDRAASQPINHGQLAGLELQVGALTGMPDELRKSARMKTVSCESKVQKAFAQIMLAVDVLRSVLGNHVPAITPNTTKIP